MLTSTVWKVRAFIIRYCCLV